MFLRIFILCLFIGTSVYAQSSKIDTNPLPYISKTDSTNSLNLLIKDLKSVLSRDYIVNSNYSVSVYSIDRKQWIFNVNENNPLTPASITKLFTTFTALYNFGKSSNIKTEIWYEDNDIDDKVINQNLYIVGYGDCLFSQKDIDTLFFIVKKAGIKEIKGDILFDLSQFDDETSRFKYSGDADMVANVGTICPFSISRKTGEQARKLVLQAIQKAGIEFTGEFGECERPFYSGAKKLQVLTRFERPLTELVNITNKNSDNYFAEHLFKLNATKNKIYDKDYDNSRDLLFATLNKLDIDCKNCDINDGSGLSRRNRLTSKAIVQLLVKANELDINEEFFNSLAVAGKDGTLRKRMQMSSAENYVNAKTGTLRNASGLAGYVTSVDGERFAFAFLFNGYNVSNYKRTEDELAELLAGFFYFNSIN